MCLTLLVCQLPASGFIEAPSHVSLAASDENASVHEARMREVPSERTGTKVTKMERMLTAPPMSRELRLHATKRSNEQNFWDDGVSGNDDLRLPPRHHGHSTPELRGILSAPARLDRLPPLMRSATSPRSGPTSIEAALERIASHQSSRDDSALP
jgi:hypothetical protein